MAKMSASDSRTLEEFGFEFSAPPEIAISRRSKHEAMWEAAKELCSKYPGQSLKVIEYDKRTTAYQTARAINNGANKAFTEDFHEWTAKASVLSADEPDTFAIWLTYNGSEEE
jgi:hypothetical protein